MATATAVRRKSFPIHNFKALDGEGTGVFEAIVSVFGNIDYAGDRVVAGAFSKSLEKWAGSGDPIPVIYSHQWDNLDAHCGEVIEAKELLAGDAQLPNELRANGGLYIKGRFDLDEDFAARLWKKLNKRLIKEFSFAYDILDEARDRNDGANNLLELDIIEVGPTLKGMNPATELLDAKSLEAGARKAGISKEQFVSALEGAVAEAKTYTMGDIGANPNSGEKAFVILPGSFEERWDQVYDEVETWAAREFGGELYDVRLEATYPDRVVFQVELWSDPWGGGEFYEAGYSIGSAATQGDGQGETDLESITLGDVTSVQIEGVVVAKNLRKSRKDARGRKTRATVAPVGHGIVKSAGKGQDRKVEDPEDSKTRNESETGNGEASRALTEIELLELA